jgi:hypothetical protein
MVTAIGIYRQLSGETALSWKNMTPVPKESRMTSNWSAVSQLSQFVLAALEGKLILDGFLNIGRQGLLPG